MRLRKTFLTQNSVKQEIFTDEEQNVNRSRKATFSNDSYDCYPEKQPMETTKAGKFEGVIELTLVEDYRLQSQIDKYNHSKERDIQVKAAIYEVLNNMVAK